MEMGQAKIKQKQLQMGEHVVCLLLTKKRIVKRGHVCFGFVFRFIRRGLLKFFILSSSSWKTGLTVFK